MEFAITFACSILGAWAIYSLAHSPDFITALADELQDFVKRLRAWSTAQRARKRAFDRAYKKPAQQAQVTRREEVEA